MRKRRRTRLQKLMDERIAVHKAANQCDKYATNRLLAGIDYLFYEVERLIVAETERRRKSK